MLQAFAVKCLIIVIIFQFNRATSESLKPCIYMTKRLFNKGTSNFTSERSNSVLLGSDVFPENDGEKEEDKEKEIHLPHFRVNFSIIFLI